MKLKTIFNKRVYAVASYESKSVEGHVFAPRLIAVNESITGLEIVPIP